MLHFDHVMLHHAILSLLLHLACEEPKSEVQAEEVQAKETNPEPKQGKPWYITPQSLTLL
jgi:hypothetical protein